MPIQGIPSLMVSKGSIVAAAAGIGTQTDTDAFTRANSSPMSGTWTGEAANPFDISSNAVIMHNVAGADASNFWNTWSHGDDQYSQAEITLVGSGSQVGLGVCVRRNTTIATVTMYRAVINDAGAIDIGSIVTGGFTQIGTRSVTYSAGTKLGLSIQGTTLKVWYGGVQQGANITTSSIASGSPGLGFSSPITSGTIDNWDAGTVP